MVLSKRVDISTDEELKHLESSNFQTDDITIFESAKRVKKPTNHQAVMELI
jgi:hypothetical protein